MLILQALCQKSLSSTFCTRVSPVFKSIDAVGCQFCQARKPETYSMMMFGRYAADMFLERLWF